MGIGNRYSIIKLVIVTLLFLGFLIMNLDMEQSHSGPKFAKDLPSHTLERSSWRLRLNASVSSAKHEVNKLHSGVQRLPPMDMINNVETMDLSSHAKLTEEQLSTVKFGADGKGGKDGWGVDDIPDPVSHILVLSSMGRSGSSFMGELISLEPNSAYFFEPIMFVQSYKGEEVTQENSLPVVMDMFNCKFNANFHDWLSSMNPRHCYRTNLTKNHLRKYGNIRPDQLTKDCLAKTSRVVKVIRMRLHWVRPLLSNPKLNVKVIHLVRDPRASFASRARLGWGAIDPLEKCRDILMDIRVVSALQKQFPGKVFSIKYESFFADPEGTAADLWGFLHGIDSSSTNSSSGKQLDLPLSWKSYLKNHTTTMVDGAYKTFRDSKQELMAWRQEIREILLLKVEKVCAEVILSLGHTIFGSLANAVNMTVPLINNSSKVKPLSYVQRATPYTF